MMIFGRIILCVSSEQLTAGYWRMGHLKDYQIFHNNPQDLDAFKAFLQLHSNTNIDCLVDAIEEDYRLEIFPHTRGKDRRDLIERKLTQAYRGSLFRTALFLDRQPAQKRKDDRFLFLGLNQTDFLKPWLEVIDAQQAPLAGVYLLSMVSQSLVKALKIKSRHLLLVEKLATGFRQSYLFKGELRMSRLATFPAEMSAESLDYFYAEEIEKTQRYLLSQRFINQVEDIQIRMPMIASPDNQFSSLVPNKIGLDFKLVDIGTMLKKLSISSRHLVELPELLHMAVLLKSSRLPSLAPLKLLSSYRVNLARQCLNILSFSILFFGLMFSAMHLKQIFNQEQMLESLKAKTHHQEIEYQKVAKDFPISPLPSDDLQRAVEIGSTLKSYQKMPTRVMQVLSKALITTPDIQVNRIKWMQTDDLRVRDIEAQSRGGQSNKEEQNLPSFPSGYLYETVFLGGEIKRFSGDYRAALSLVNQLTEILKSDANVAYVEIVQAPVNVSSYSSLEGSTTDEVEAKQSAALFTLKVILHREAR
jgi:hypothetical protein